MRNVKKGFIFSLLVVFIVVLMIGGGIYYYSQNKSQELLTQQTATIASTAPLLNPNGNATQRSHYCIGKICYKENGASVFRELFGRVLNAVAVDDPKSYIGDVVDGFYSDNHWFVGCTQLKQKAVELIAGRTINRDKILSVANWVTSSKSYGIVPTGTVSICDLFKADAGVCEDAAALSTAMYRSVGIPARVVNPVMPYTIPAHAYTQVYSSSSGWSAVDTTFGGGTRSIFKPTVFLSTQKYIKFNKPKEIVIGVPNSNEFTYYLAEGVFVYQQIQNISTSTKYGTITYIKPSYWDSSLSASINSASVSAKNIQCDYYNCTSTNGTNTEIPLPQSYTMLKLSKIIHVDMNGRIAQEIDNEFAVNVDLRKDYYVTATFPSGNYRFEYRANDNKLVAYADLNIKPGGIITLKPSMFTKGDEVTKTQFNNFIKYLKNVSQ